MLFKNGSAEWKCNDTKHIGHSFALTKKMIHCSDDIFISQLFITDGDDKYTRWVFSHTLK